jgi:DNA-binding CsgD family transcriptional regulator/PAS domain-containing protein
MQRSACASGETVCPTAPRLREPERAPAPVAEPDVCERVSQLIGDIYDASLDPSQWPRALERTCDYIGGITAALQSHDSSQQSACFYFTWNDNPDYTKSYVEKYARINPAIVPATLQTQVGDVSAFLDFIPLDEYVETQFYKEWAGPQGYIDAVQATLEKSGMTYAAVAVMRHERDGRVDSETRERMRLLAPHFRRAIAISKVIDLHKVEAATLADTLDGLASGTLLVDAGGCVVHANRAGCAMLGEGSIVRNMNGKLVVCDPSADATLHDIFVNAQDGDRAVGVRGIGVPITAENGAPWVAHVLPLTSGARRAAGTSYSAVAAVFVRKASVDLPHPLETLKSVYRLTPAELRVVMAIIDVGGVPEVASVLGTSENTVRTHLQRVFDKTGTRRQADLVKLVAGYTSPLRGPDDR